jgi:hypothetical protein
VLDGNKLKITMQSPTIRTVISQTICGMQASLALDNPFPDNADRDVTIKKVMLAVAKELGEELGGDFKAIRSRLKEDASYRVALAVPVRGRLTQIYFSGNDTRIGTGPHPDLSRLPQGCVRKLSCCHVPSPRRQ